MPVFTIKTLAAESDEILAEYPYWIWYPSEQTLTISKSTFQKTKAYEANGIIFRAPGADADIETTTFYYYYITPIEPDVTVVLRYYANLGVWQAEIPWELETDDGWIECPIGYQHQYSTSTLAVPIYTNGHTIATGSGTGITNSWSINGSLPSDMPDVTIGMGDINATINDALNATTSATTQAGTIQSTVNTKLDQYEQGQITSNQMQSVIDTANTQLDDLASQSGNTLSDQIAINNAQNAVQIAQDQVLSQNLIDAVNDLFNFSDNNFGDISTYITQIKEIWLGRYFSGDVTKEDILVNGVKRQDGNLEFASLLDIKAELQTGFLQLAKTEKDLAFIDQLSNTIDNTIDIINSSGDVDIETAEAAESQEQAEIDLLNDMVSVMQDAETDSIMHNQQVQSDLEEISSWIEPIWENKFIKNLITIVCILVPIAVILDMRYRGL